jgi:hypothetical protein
MCFNVEHFGTLLGQFFHVFGADLEQFGTLKIGIWNTWKLCLFLLPNTLVLCVDKVPKRLSAGKVVHRSAHIKIVIASGSEAISAR